MIVLMQFLRMIDDLELFQGLFTDISEELELGYTPTELCNEMLFDHFGLTIEDERQLQSFADLVQHKTKSSVSAINVEKLRRGL